MLARVVLDLEGRVKDKGMLGSVTNCSFVREISPAVDPVEGHLDPAALLLLAPVEDFTYRETYFLCHILLSHNIAAFASSLFTELSNSQRSLQSA